MIFFFFLSSSDTLYRLSFELKPTEKAVWEATGAIIETCQNKGASDIDCRNYIMVLQNYGNTLYACGTYAFSPYCSWRQVRFDSSFSFFFFQSAKAIKIFKMQSSCFLLVLVSRWKT